MKKTKKQVNILIGLAIILLSPLIIPAMILFIPYGLYQNHKEKKKYRASPYYQRFGVRYRAWRPNQPAYRFYNDAVAAGFEPNLIHQASDDMEYLIMENTVYVFQRTSEFDAVFYSDERREWRVLEDGDAGSLTEAWEKCVGRIETDLSGKELRMLLERWLIWPRNSGEAEYEDSEDNNEDLALELLPSYVTVVENYLDILGGTK